MPVVRACPTPSTLIVGCFGRSPSTSAMMAVVFADPMSSPATRRSEFMAVWRSLGHDSGDRSPWRASVSARDPLPPARCRRGAASVRSSLARTVSVCDAMLPASLRSSAISPRPGRRAALTRAYNAGMPARMAPSSLSRRHVALHEHRRVDGHARRVDRQRGAAIVVGAQSPRRRTRARPAPVRRSRRRAFPAAFGGHWRAATPG